MLLQLPMLPGASALDPNSVANVFDRLASNKELANPSVVVLDQKTGEVVFSKNPYSLRKPASVQKIFAAVSALTHMQPSDSFTTTVSLGQQERTLVIEGERDPWISFSHKEALRLGRTSLPRIGHKSLAALEEANPEIFSKITIYYNNLYSQDVAQLKTFYKQRGIIASMKRSNSAEIQELAGEEIFSSQSPELQRMLSYILTWSDNALTERIARLAARAAGESFDEKGVAATFIDILESFDIDSSKLLVQDASGLSRQNKVTAAQVGELLVKIRHEPQFAPLISGLPIGGITGTMQDRFRDTAPDAIGLVKAKTGTLRGTTNLAGYVESGDREYAFVIIADQHPRTITAAKRAKATIDRILGRIAAPLLPEILTEPGELNTEVIATI
jgi:serine-type D-Ala-D-Ala carboxypeptidase/endopeptidase (penicillin-binding protein 4)